MNAVHEQDQREGGNRDGGVVGGDHPRHAFDRGVELRIKLRQREHDDRGICEGDRYGRCDEQRDHTVRLGTGLPGFARCRHRRPA
jgi:hypothetical protein